MKNIIIIDDNIEINLTIKNEFTFNYIVENIMSILSDKKIFLKKEIENNRKIIEEIKKKKICTCRKDILSKEFKEDFIEFLFDSTLISNKEVEIIMEAETEDDFLEVVSSDIANWYKKYKYTYDYKKVVDELEIQKNEHLFNR